jgi:glycosyltransferase involved in cell wall biosynthesis
MIKVSIVIPCYNCESCVSRAIDSVLQQEGVSLEVILVDNKSSDNTLVILNQYREVHPDFIKVLSESKKGAPAARNTGLKAATGIWVQFLDADDEIQDGKLKRQIDIASKSGADIIAGTYLNIQEFKGRSKLIQKVYHTSRIILGKANGTMDGYVLKTLRKPVEGNPWKSLIGGKLGITSANLWKREKLEIVNGWDEKLTSSQEYDLMFRMMAVNCIISTDYQPSALRYKLENSISSGKDVITVLRITDNYIDLRERIVAFLKSKGELSSDLQLYTDEVIYTYLMRSKDRAPHEIALRIKHLNADVATSVLLSNNLMYYFRSIFKS